MLLGRCCFGCAQFNGCISSDVRYCTLLQVTDTDWYQVVHSVLHNCANDTDLDISCVSPPHHWTSCRCPQPDGGTKKSIRYHSCRFYPTGYRLLGLNDDILCLHIPSYDSKAPARKHKTGHVCVGRTQRVHGGRRHWHGRRRSTSTTQGLHGGLRCCGNDPQSRCFLDKSLDMGSGFLVLLHIRWRPLVLRWPREDGISDDLVLVRLSKYRAHHSDFRHW